MLKKIKEMFKPKLISKEELEDTSRDSRRNFLKAAASVPVVLAANSLIPANRTPEVVELKRLPPPKVTRIERLSAGPFSAEGIGGDDILHGNKGFRNLATFSCMSTSDYNPGSSPNCGPIILDRRLTR